MALVAVGALLVFGVVVGGFGVLTSAPFSSAPLFGARWFAAYGVLLVLGGVVGAACGRGLRRRVGWRRGTPRTYRSLPRRRRLLLRWSIDRAISGGDPAVAAAAAERLEHGLRMLPEVTAWYRLLLRVLVWFYGLLALALAVETVVGWSRGRGTPVWVLVPTAGVAIGTVLLLGMRRLTRIAMERRRRRMERTLAFCRAVMAAAESGSGGAGPATPH